MPALTKSFRFRLHLLAVTLAIVLPGCGGGDASADNLASGEAETATDSGLMSSMAVPGYAAADTTRSVAPSVRAPLGGGESPRVLADPLPANLPAAEQSPSEPAQDGSHDLPGKENGSATKTGQVAATNRPWTQQGACNAATGSLASTGLCASGPTTTYAGRTLYVATGGSDAWTGSARQPFASLQRAVDMAMPGDTLILRAGVYSIAQPVQVREKVGMPGAPITLIGEDGAILRAGNSTAPGVWRGLLEIERSAHVIVRNLSVENSGFFGFRVRNSQNIELDGNRSTISLGSAIYVESSRDIALIHNDVSRFCDKNQFGADGRTGCQEGISLAAVDGFAVYGNRVHDAMQSPNARPGGGEGIDAKQGSQNGIIAFNSVWNLVQLGIYADAYSEGVRNIAIYGNRVWRCNAGIVVSSEAGGLAADISITDNIIYDVGSDGILISDFKSRVRPDGNGPRRNIRIANNTIANAGIREAKLTFFSPSASSSPASAWGSGINVATANVAALQILDNIVYGSSTSPIRLPASLRASAVVESNLQWPAPTARSANEYLGVAPIIADPLFVSVAASDWRLSAQSPAIGRGTGVGGASFVDGAGVVRPTGALDVGALAYRR